MNPNRIDQCFAACRLQGRRALIGYLTAGDPTFEASLNTLRQAVDAGVEILEIGVPFSDPTADGPVIQAASQRALAAGMSLTRALELVAALRETHAVPIVLFGYANPFYRYGYDAFSRAAAAAGVDGVLVVDLPFEECGDLRSSLAAAGVHMIPLIAPTTPLARAGRILAEASGFVYYIMVTGVTGVRAATAHDVDEHVARLRTVSALPVAVGFGVSNGEQARQAGRSADAVVVGSALVQAAQEGRLSSLVQDLKQGLRGEGISR